MHDSPLVSIIIPTFNREAFLRDCLTSIFEQDFENWEAIIIDDGSKSSYLDCVKIEFPFNDSRFKYFARPTYHPKGPGACRNYGLLKSSGKYIQLLDDDDLLPTNKLTIQVNILENCNNNKVFSTCDWDIYWPGKKLTPINSFKKIGKIQPSVFFKLLGLNKTFMPCSAYLTPLELILTAGFWDTRLSLNDDAEYFTRVLIHSDYIINTSLTHVLYRNHNAERVSTKCQEKDLNSYLLSLNLMQSHLLAKGYPVTEYFRWKLLKILFDNWKDHSELLKVYNNLYRQFNLPLSYQWFYHLKLKLYNIIYPHYKKYIRRYRYFSQYKFLKK